MSGARDRLIQRELAEIAEVQNEAPRVIGSGLLMKPSFFRIREVRIGPTSDIVRSKSWRR